MPRGAPRWLRRSGDCAAGRWSAARHARRQRRPRPAGYARLDHVSAHDLLESIRFPATARNLAFKLFSRSFFADPRLLSAAEMALMFHVSFLGSADGLLFYVPNGPFPRPAAPVGRAATP
ncbi:hypothetical protein GCM10023324_01380 [Streptomyces youssoufiensis]